MIHQETSQLFVAILHWRIKDLIVLNGLISSWTSASNPLANLQLFILYNAKLWRGGGKFGELMSFVNILPSQIQYF